MGESVACNDSRPVSYTHLDVYKRQAYIVKNRTEEDLEKSKYINKNKLIIIFTPVSYTHLVSNMVRVCNFLIARI